MELNWSTFILEMINFLVLIWILKHFFYAPIQKVMLARQKMVDEKIDNANKLEIDVKKLQETYENRLQEWNQEKEKNKQLFLQEVEEWKEKERAQFLKKMDEEKNKRLVHEQQNLANLKTKNIKKALFISGQFAAKFLSELSDDHLENKIIDKLIGDLTHFSKEKILILEKALKNEPKLVVQTAYKLSQEHQKKLADTVQQLLNAKGDIKFIQNPELIAGVNLQIGSIFIKANLRDELNFFIETDDAIA